MESHTTQTHVNPANKETPPPTPRFKNNGLANKIAPAASDDLQKSFPANNEAAYFGYVNGT